MAEHRIAMGSPTRSTRGWFWNDEKGWAVHQPRETLACPDATLDEPAPPADSGPREPPLTVQLDRLTADGWEVLTSLHVSARDQSGHAQVGVLLHRPTVLDRARLR